MKGTENIIAHIRAEAEAKAADILARAEEQCEEIRADYDKKAREAYAERIRAGVRECEDRTESMNKIAGMEARKSLLALKQELVAACFTEAERKLLSLPEPEYAAFLARLACSASVTGDEELILNAADRAGLGDKVLSQANALLQADGKRAALTLSETVGAFSGGLLLRRGNIETNCTVGLLVDSCRNEMSSELAAVLFA